MGQETVHAREHARLNERLAELGYPTRHLDRRARFGFRIVERTFTPTMKLAATAALEHVTATLADTVLGSEEIQQLFTDDEVRRLIVWHAIDEAEHRAVAFDVFRAVGGPEWMRVWAFRILWLTTGLDLGSALLTSLLADPDGRRPSALRASWRTLRTSPFTRVRLWRRLAAYTAPGFHPGGS